MSFRDTRGDTVYLDTPSDSSSTANQSAPEIATPVLEYRWAREWGRRSLFSVRPEIHAVATASGGTYSFDGGISAEAYAFNNRIQLASVGATLIVPDPNHENGNNIVRAWTSCFGADVFPRIDEAHSWNTSFSVNRDFPIRSVSSPPYSATILIVFVPVTFSVQAELQHNARLTGSADSNAARLGFGPTLGVWLVGSVGIGSSTAVLEAGVSGRLELVSIGPQLSLNIEKRRSPFPPVGVVSSNLRFAGTVLSGGFELYACADLRWLGLGRKCAKKLIVRWNGIPFSSPVGDASLVEGTIACSPDCSPSLCCDRCGGICPGQQVCDVASSCDRGSGACVPVPCPAGQTRCDTGCFNLQTDPSHCGSCSNVCPDRSLCTNGGCEPDTIIRRRVCRPGTYPCPDCDRCGASPAECRRACGG